MVDQKQTTKEQKNHIDATLKRIRAGLKRDDVLPFDEPAHYFKPEAVNDKK